MNRCDVVVLKEFIKLIQDMCYEGTLTVANANAIVTKYEKMIEALD